MADFKPTKQVLNVIAGLGGGTEVRLTREWLPWDGEYPACPSAYAPLINGEQTFGAVAKAIETAQKSIEIITWGFQASMYPVRTATGGGKTIGQLLEEAANRGVQVRILVWFNSVKQKFVGGNLPGWEAYLPEDPSKQHGRFMTNEERYQHALKRVDNQRASLLATGSSLSYHKDKDNPQELKDAFDKQYEYDKRWHFRANSGHIKNLVIKVRDMGLRDAGWAKARLKEKVPAQYQLSDDISALHALAQTTGTTHHQKTVMVDYEDPERAVGFVMGHNMLSLYWDRDAHSYNRQAPDVGRDGPTTWQDISSCIYGEALRGLNDNFARAWARDTGDGSLKARDSIPKEHYSPTAARLRAINNRLGLKTPLVPVMGRICRTQPQDNVYDILRAYMESVKKARKYIYIENQYFRFKDMVKQIHTALAEIKQAGFTRDLYLFVVTNSTTDPDIVAGGLQTWKMLEALGRGDRMPAYTAKQYNKDPANKDSPVTPQDIQPQQIPGLQSHICTLVSMDSPEDDRQRTYVHSKLMMVDDVFMIQGSANINLRSMVFDTESAIAIQDTDRSNIIPAMRNKLWGLHTANKEGCTGSDYRKVFDRWDTLLNENSKRWANSKGGDLVAPLIKFIDNSPKLKDQD
jgi:phosphatidylserine/phosphatidylglycerophosphate/cardiolipin synthase-like enzyme